MNTIKKIDKIRFVRDIDIDADTSHIGEFSDTPKEGAIDREERGDMNRGEYRYFNPANPEYAEQEYKQIMDIEKGHTSFYGVSAEALVYLSSVRQTIQSGGLWGMEHDGSKESEEYFKQEEADQLEELANILKKRPRLQRIRNQGRS